MSSKEDGAKAAASEADAASVMPTWPLCNAAALEVVRELGLDYYDDPEHLPFDEVLRLLARTRLQLGHGIPPELEGGARFQGTPWRVSLSSAHPRRNDINDLLHHSMRVQMATVRDTEFSDFVLSDACISTAGLMFVYFRALGIESRLCTGVQTFNKKPDSDCTPHCWLEVVPGEPIETTFVYVPKARGGNAAFFMLRHRDLYVEEDPSATQRNIFFGEDKFVGSNSSGDGRRRRIAMPHSLAVYREYGTEAGVEKHLVASLRTSAMNPCVKMYDVAMRDYIQRVHGVAVEGLEEKWKVRCWQCGDSARSEEENKLKLCGTCRMACYCGVECQQSDWKVHKLLHREIKNYAGSVMV